MLWCLSYIKCTSAFLETLNQVLDLFFVFFFQMTFLMLANSGPRLAQHHIFTNGPPVVHLCIVTSRPELGAQTKSWWPIGGFFTGWPTEVLHSYFEKIGKLKHPFIVMSFYSRSKFSSMYEQFETLGLTVHEFSQFSHTRQPMSVSTYQICTCILMVRTERGCFNFNVRNMMDFEKSRASLRTNMTNIL